MTLVAKKPWAIDTKYFTACAKPLYLVSMAVHPAAQGQGVGRKLLAGAARIATERAAGAIRLDAFDAPAGAGEFYRKCGWREMGRVTYRSSPLIYFELLL